MSADDSDIGHICTLLHQIKYPATDFTAFISLHLYSIFSMNKFTTSANYTQNTFFTIFLNRIQNAKTRIKLFWEKNPRRDIPPCPDPRC